MPKQIAEWNTDLKLWGNLETDLLSERWEPFLETWPISGTMQNGKVYELQTQERPTSDSESLLLPTLKARDSQAEGYEAGLRRTTPQVGTIVKGIVEKDSRVFLPTVRAQNSEDRNNKIWARDPKKPQNLENALAVTVPGLTLLRSPKASEGQGGALGEAEARKRGNTVGVRDQVMDLVASQGHKVSRTEVNLPTPTVSDIFTGSLSSKQHSEGSLHSVSLAQIVHRTDLFPTPTTQDGKNNGGPSQFNRNTKPLNTEVLLIGTPRATASESSSNQVAQDAPKARIEDQVLATSWGKFEPAIRRWEAILGRQAPSPTKADGKEGAHRLSSSFTEWMMGLPENWICGHDLKRNDELKLAGNGVVPQQAELALRMLLNSDEE